jgi:hypothetical protein
LLRFIPASAKKKAGEKPFSWAKPAYVTFCSSNFNVQGRILSTCGHALTLYIKLVWTPCLMHRCVYLTVHITKLQLQTTFPKPLYISNFACIHGTLIFRVFRCTSGCIWLFWSDIDIRPPLGRGMPFPSQRHMRRRGVIYFCQGFLPYMMPFINGWQDEWMDGWMDGSHDEKSFTKNNHNILYYVTCMGVNQW